MTTSQDFRVFLSAVSSEFGEARSGVASDLRARGIEVKVQEDFRQEAESETTLAKLHDYIRNCSAVVCVIGERSGSVPPPAAAGAYEEILPEGLERASYTQWELLFARALGRRLSVYHAGAGYDPDQPEPTGEDEPELQARFVDWLFEEQGLDRGTFSNPDALGRLVLREDWPKRSSRKPVVLPYPSLGELFRGREEFLERLRESLDGTGAGRATAIAGRVLHGLGGVGKTRLAVEYAWRYLNDYSAALFVAGETPELLRQNLAALCGPEALDLPEKEAPEEAVQVAAALGWLAEHPGWLLIVDNLDTPTAAAAAEDLLPRLRGGHILLTGRLADWGADIRALELDVLEEDEAARFLLDRTKHRRRRLATDEADAREMARELGGLALALEQAGAYVVQLRRSLSQYLEDWRARERGVRAWHDERLMNYPRSVAVTWQTTVDRLSPGELALLRLLAWFAPEPVPLFVFDGDGARSIWEEAVSLLGDEQDEEGGEVDPGGTLSGLASYSMLRWDAEAEAVSVHRVVQEILRGSLDEPARREWAALSLRLLDAARPGDPGDVRSWPEWDALRPHVALGARFGEEAGALEQTAVLMNELGLLLSAKALHAEAEPLMRRALEIDESNYGADHSKIAIRLANLAGLLLETDRLGEAEPLMRRALKIDESTYGADHPRVAAQLSNLAQLLQDTNRLGEAEPLMRRALDIDESSYGADHEDVARDLANLAALLQATNRLAEAEPLQRRALEIDESNYGTDHPRVAIQLSNLAQLLHDTDRLGEAEPLMRRALEIDESSYGADHPAVAIRLANLAQLLWATTRLGEAEPLMRRALEIDESTYGADHPRVAAQLNNLALLLQDTDRLGEAEPLIRRALEIDESSYGADHPRVAIRLDNLAQLLKATTRLGEAEPLMRRMVTIFLRFDEVTGHEHPNFRAGLENYTGLLAEMGRSEEEIRAAIEGLNAEVAAEVPSGGGEWADS